jgi:hypothetical protein
MVVIAITNDPFRAPASTPSYVCHPPAWDSAGGDCLIPGYCGTNIDHKASTEKNKNKMAKPIKRRAAIQTLHKKADIS